MRKLFTLLFLQVFSVCHLLAQHLDLEWVKGMGGANDENSYAMATDAAGNVTNCTWTITVLDYQLPVISVQPANTSACAGSNATFSVTSSNALNYQWQISAGGGVWNNIAGATGPTYTINNQLRLVDPRGSGMPLLLRQQRAARIQGSSGSTHEKS